MQQNRVRSDNHFPLVGGIFLGVGLGGFVDIVVFHQILQWHHTLSSAGFPPNSLRNLQINTLADGLFHMIGYVFLVAGLAILWNRARQGHVQWPMKTLLSAILIGWGIFNLVEGIIDHQVLGIHHVNETVPHSQWIYWDMGFLLWGATLLIGGWLLWSAAQNVIEPRAQAVEAAGGSAPAALPVTGETRKTTKTTRSGRKPR